MSAAASVATDLLCPSAEAGEGALVVGMRGPDGRVAYVTPPTPASAELLDGLREAGLVPERRFRFAQPCARGGCGHWTGGECGLVGRILASLAEPGAAPPEAPRRCGIRASCRWFAQRGWDACRACPLVATARESEGATASAAT